MAIRSVSSPRPEIPPSGKAKIPWRNSAAICVAQSEYFPASALSPYTTARTK